MRKITQCINELREEYLDKELIRDYREINSGLCVEFAEEIESRVSSACEVISNDYFMNREDCDGWNGNEKDIWDENSLTEYHSMPPHSFTVEDLTKQIRGYHCWVYYNERHYDAECPEGVNSFFDLPFFKRHLGL